MILVYQQFRRWDEAGCFEAMVNACARSSESTKVARASPARSFWTDARCQSNCESGVRAGYDGYKRRWGSKVHMAVDTLGQLIAMTVTSADEQERAQVKALCEAVQEATGETVKLARANQGYTGEQARQDAQASEIDLRIVKLPEANGFVLLPRRWVVERSFGWLSRFRRLNRDFERLPQVLASLHFVVFAILMLPSTEK